MQLTEALTLPAGPAPSAVLVRLALEEDRAALFDLFRAHLAKVSPWLKFDTATACATFDAYIQTASPTIHVAEDPARRLVGYCLATFNYYSATSGYAVCLEELCAPDLHVAAALDEAFGSWTEKLSPPPLEILVGIDVDLAPAAADQLQPEGGR